MAKVKAKRSKSILEDELEWKEKELRRSIKSVLETAEKSLAHVRKLVDLDMIPLMVSDVPVQELIALCGLFRADSELQDLRRRVTSRRQR